MTAMDETYLRRGISGLSRVLDSHLPDDTTDRNWFSGHWPCAVVAAYYFCRDNRLEPGVDEVVTREVDRLMARFSPLFAPDDPEPDGEGDADAPGRDGLARALEASVDRYLVSGHNAIYAAYAVQVLTEAPELASPAVRNRLQALIAYFAGRTDGIDPREALAAGTALTPPYADESDLVRHVFARLRHAPRLTDRRRLLFDGHLITHAHALVTLARCGYGPVARRGFDAHRVHLERDRDYRAQHLAERWTEKVTVPDHPFSLAFWDRDFDRFDRCWEFGHVFKYLHSFYSLAGYVEEPFELRCCERQLAYLI